MKVLLWCCKWLGYQTLATLVRRASNTDKQKLEIVGVVVSRRDTWSHSLEKLARAAHVPVTCDQELIETQADMGLCVGFPYKLGVSTLQLCRLGILNLHFAPLPEYRGAGTLTWALVNQESEYGVTLHWMDENLDTGRIVERTYFPLSPESPISVIEKQLEKHAWHFLKSWLEGVVTGNVPVGVSQAEIVKKTGVRPRFYSRASVDRLYLLSPSWPADKILRYLRALPIKPGKCPYFLLNNQKIFLHLSPPSHTTHTHF